MAEFNLGKASLEVTEEARKARELVEKQASEALKKTSKNVELKPNMGVDTSKRQKKAVDTWKKEQLSTIGTWESESLDTLKKPPTYTTTYEGLTPEEQVILKDYGIDEVNQRRQLASEKAYSQALKSSKEAMSQNNILVAGNQYIPKSEFEALSPEDQKLVQSVGLERFNQISGERATQYNQSIQAEAERSVRQGKLDFEASSVKLNNGEYISKEEYNKLSQADQNSIMSLGVSGFNKEQERLVAVAKQAQLDFEASSVKLNNGEYISTVEFNKLSAADQASLKSLGVSAFNTEQDRLAAEQERQRVAFESSSVKLNNGEYISRDKFNALSTSDQASLMTLGVEGFNSVEAKRLDDSKKAQAAFEASSVKLSSGEYVSKAEFNKLSATDQAALVSKGIAGFNTFLEQAALTAQQVLQSTFNNSSVKLNSGEYVSKEEFNKLSEADQASLVSQGVASFNQVKAQEALVLQQQQTAFEASSVKLSTGEYVSKTEFNKLSTSDQASLVAKGVSGFNSYKDQVALTAQQAAQAEFNNSSVKLSTGEYVSKPEFDKLALVDQTSLKSLGVTGYNQSKTQEALALQQRQAAFEASSVKLGTGEYVSKADFNLLSLEDQASLMSKGVAGFNTFLEQKALTAQQKFVADFNNSSVKLNNGEYVAKAEFDKLSTSDQASLRALGISDFNTAGAKKVSDALAAQAAFEASSVKLSTGEYVAKSDFTKLSSSEQASLMSKGIAGFNSYQAQVALTAQQASQAAFDNSSVKLNTGEFVTKTEFDKLSLEDQTSLRSLGVAAFNTLGAKKVSEAQASKAAFEASSVKLGTGEYVSKADFNLLSLEDQTSLMVKGVAGFNTFLEQKALTAQQKFIADFYSSSVKLNNGEYVSKTEFDKLSTTDQSSLKSLGTLAFNAAGSKKVSDSLAAQAAFEASSVKLGTGEYVSKADFTKLSPPDQASLMSRGIAGFNSYQAQVALTAQQASQAAFDNSSVKLNTGEFVTKTEFAKLSSLDQATLLSKGVTEFNRLQDLAVASSLAAKEAFEASSIKLNTGEYVSKVDFDKLSTEDKALLMAQGTSGFNTFQTQKALTAQQKLLADFTNSSVKLSNGEYVSKAEFDKLSTTDQTSLKALGVAGFNIAGAQKASEALAAKAAFEASSVKLNNGEYVPKVDFDKLSLANQNLLKSLGVAGFNSAEEARVAGIVAKEKLEFESTSTKLNNGEFVLKADFDKLSPEDQASLRLLGVAGFNTAQAKKASDAKLAQTEFERTSTKLNNGEYIKTVDFLALSPELQASLKALGVDAFNTAQAKKALEAKTAFEAMVKISTKLDNGEYVDSVAFNKLSLADQSSLKKLGIVEFNKFTASRYTESQAALAELMKTNLQLKNGEWVNAVEFNKLSSADSILLMNLGVAGYNLKKEQDATLLKSQLEANLAANPKDAQGNPLVKLNNGEYTLKSKFDLLTPIEQATLKAQGTAAFNVWHIKTETEAAQALLDANPTDSQGNPLTKLNSGEYILTSEFSKLSSQDSLVLKNMGIRDYNAWKAQEAINAQKIYQDPWREAVKLRNGDYVGSIEFNQLSSQDATVLMDMGIRDYNAWKVTQAQNAQSAGTDPYRNAVRLFSGERVDAIEFNKLNSADATLLMTKGIQAYNTSKGRTAIVAATPEPIILTPANTPKPIVAAPALPIIAPTLPKSLAGAPAKDITTYEELKAALGRTPTLAETESLAGPLPSFGGFLAAFAPVGIGPINIGYLPSAVALGTQQLLGLKTEQTKAEEARQAALNVLRPQWAQEVWGTPSLSAPSWIVSQMFPATKAMATGFQAVQPDEWIATGVNAAMLAAPKLISVTKGLLKETPIVVKSPGVVEFKPSSTGLPAEIKLLAKDSGAAFEDFKTTSAKVSTVSPEISAAYKASLENLKISQVKFETLKTESVGYQVAVADLSKAKAVIETPTVTKFSNAYLDALNLQAKAAQTISKIEQTPNFLEAQKLVVANMKALSKVDMFEVAPSITPKASLKPIEATTTLKPIESPPLTSIKTPNLTSKIQEAQTLIVSNIKALGKISSPEAAPSISPKASLEPVEATTLLKPVESPNLPSMKTPSLISKLNEAQYALKAADTKLIQGLEGVPLTTKQLQMVEALSGFKGIAEPIKTLTIAETKLSQIAMKGEALRPIEKPTVPQATVTQLQALTNTLGRTPTIREVQALEMSTTGTIKVTPTQYLTDLVVKTQAELQAKLQPRWQEQLTRPGWDDTIRYATEEVSSSQKAYNLAKKALDEKVSTTKSLEAKASDFPSEINLEALESSKKSLQASTQAFESAKTSLETSTRDLVTLEASKASGEYPSTLAPQIKALALESGEALSALKTLKAYSPVPEPSLSSIYKAGISSFEASKAPLTSLRESSLSYQVALADLAQAKKIMETPSVNKFSNTYLDALNLETKASKVIASFEGSPEFLKASGNQVGNLNALKGMDMFKPSYLDPTVEASLFKPRNPLKPIERPDLPSMERPSFASALNEAQYSVLKSDTSLLKGIEGKPLTSWELRNIEALSGFKDLAVPIKNLTIAEARLSQVSKTLKPEALMGLTEAPKISQIKALQDLVIKSQETFKTQLNPRWDEAKVRPGWDDTIRYATEEVTNAKKGYEVAKAQKDIWASQKNLEAYKETKGVYEAAVNDLKNLEASKASGDYVPGPSSYKASFSEITPTISEFGPSLSPKEVFGGPSPVKLVDLFESLNKPLKTSKPLDPISLKDLYESLKTSPKAEPIKPKGTPEAQKVQDLVDKISKGEKDFTPEELQTQINNKVAIEKALQDKLKGSSKPSSTPEAQTGNLKASSKVATKEVETQTPVDTQGSLFELSLKPTYETPSTSPLEMGAPRWIEAPGKAEVPYSKAGFPKWKETVLDPLKTTKPSQVIGPTAAKPSPIPLMPFSVPSSIQGLKVASPLFDKSIKPFVDTPSTQPFSGPSASPIMSSSLFKVSSTLIAPTEASVAFSQEPISQSPSVFSKAASFTTTEASAPLEGTTPEPLLKATSFGTIEEPLVEPTTSPLGTITEPLVDPSSLIFKSSGNLPSLVPGPKVGTLSVPKTSPSLPIGGVSPYTTLVRSKMYSTSIFNQSKPLPTISPSLYPATQIGSSTSPLSRPTTQPIAQPLVSPRNYPYTQVGASTSPAIKTTTQPIAQPRVTPSNYPYTQVGASTNPLVKPHTLSITKPIVSPKLQDLTKTNLQNKLQNLTKTNLQNKLQNLTKPLVKPQVKTQTQIKTQVKVQTRVEVQTPPKPITPRPLKPLLLPGAPKVGGPEALPPGTVTWNQGIQKKTLIPGEVKPRSTYRRSHPKGSGVPSTSLKVVGGPSDIIEARVDLGVTDLYIDPVRGKVAFRPGGLKTNISENLGNTQGMKLLRKPKEVLRAPTQKQEKPGLISRIIRGK